MMASVLSFLLLLQNVQSLETLRFSRVIEQGYDTSCGLSVISDLLTHYWNLQVAERELIADMARIRGDELH